MIIHLHHYDFGLIRIFVFHFSKFIWTQNRINWHLLKFLNTLLAHKIHIPNNNIELLSYMNVHLHKCIQGVGRVGGGTFDPILYTSQVKYSLRILKEKKGNDGNKGGKFTNWKFFFLNWRHFLNIVEGGNFFLFNKFECKTSPVHWLNLQLIYYIILHA